MSTEIDFKSLWNKQPVDASPDIKEITAKAEKLRRYTARKLIIMNLILLGTVVFIIAINLNIHKEWLTTKIGIILMVTGMLLYLVVYNRMIPLLFKNNPDNSSQEYLNQLIAIKRKHAFLDTIMINIYFTFLSSGMLLYMVQFALRMKTIGGIAYYGIAYYVVIVLWMAFAWFYLKPRDARKRQKKFGDMITRLEEVNKQLKEE